MDDPLHALKQLENRAQWAGSDAAPAPKLWGASFPVRCKMSPQKRKKNPSRAKRSRIGRLNFACGAVDTLYEEKKKNEDKKKGAVEVTLPAIPWVCSMKFFQLSPAPCAEGRSAAAAPWSCALSPSPLHCTSSFQPNMTMSVCAAGAFCLLLSTGRVCAGESSHRAPGTCFVPCQ